MMVRHLGHYGRKRIPGDQMSYRQSSEVRGAARRVNATQIHRRRAREHALTMREILCPVAHCTIRTLIKISAEKVANLRSDSIKKPHVNAPNRLLPCYASGRNHKARAVVPDPVPNGNGHAPFR